MEQDGMGSRAAARCRKADAMKKALRRKGDRGITTGQIDDLITGRGWSMASVLDDRPDFNDEIHRRETWQRYKDRVYEAMAKHTGTPPQRHPAGHYDYESFDPAELKADQRYLRRDPP
jgi:hypothetical protein